MEAVAYCLGCIIKMYYVVHVCTLSALVAAAALLFQYQIETIRLLLRYYWRPYSHVRHTFSVK